MVTCKKCGYGQQGVWFKNKICPRCGQRQEKEFRKNQLEIEDVEDIIVEKPDDFFEDSGYIPESIPATETVFEEDKLDSYRLPTLEPDIERKILEEDEIGSHLKKKRKMRFSKEQWEIITRRIYLTLEKMLFDMNPKFYASDEGQELRKLNQEISAIIIADWEINPIWALILGHVTYLLPAFTGSREKKKEAREGKPESKKKKSKKDVIDPKAHP